MAYGLLDIFSSIAPLSILQADNGKEFSNIAPGGKKKMMVDLFGDWAPCDTLTISEAELVDFPDITVKKANILEVITLTGLGTIPYTALDKLRLEHTIDVTGISLSQTHLGHLYRAHVLTTNK